MPDGGRPGARPAAPSAERRGRSAEQEPRWQDGSCAWFPFDLRICRAAEPLIESQLAATPPCERRRSPLSLVAETWLRERESALIRGFGARGLERWGTAMRRRDRSSSSPAGCPTWSRPACASCSTPGSISKTSRSPRRARRGGEDGRRAGADRHRRDRCRPARRRPGPNLKLIANFGNGVDNIDVAAALARGITVTNTPGVLTEDTADMTMALILAVRAAHPGGRPRSIPDGEWAGWSPTWMLGRRITGKRLGIVGMGRIGQALARRAKAFGLSIHYHNRRHVPPHDRGGARGDLLGEPRPDAGPHGHRLGELPAHAGDLPPALGAPPQADEARCDHREHRARRDHRRDAR